MVDSCSLKNPSSKNINCSFNLKFIYQFTLIFRNSENIQLKSKFIGDELLKQINLVPF